MNLSEYNKGDVAEIEKLFAKVFSDSEGSVEGLLIGELVHELFKTTDAHDIYGFVATENDLLLGSIIFTKLTFESGINAFILSPVAILTTQQGKGIGQKLIKYGIQHLEKQGVKLVFTYGDPDYYSKVGFRPITEEIVKAPLKLSQPEGWLCQSLVGDVIKPIMGNSYCVEALNRPEYW